MITEEEVQLSKLSYTDKDFASIYPELLDLAKKLTNKWDPSLSNESDPGVVLLKEGAFIADHNNYNIDKNVLENFLPSATQDVSVRNLTEMNGYTPRYYVSATGDVSVSYEPETTDENFAGFTFPAFTLVITDEAGKITYTQAEPLTINTYKTAATCTFIQGSLETLRVNDTETILLDNIDNNNRVYFPVSYVAQNGVYITNVGDSEFWTRDNYLLTKPLRSKIFKVDYDSVLGLPYVEFPSDIESIIGDGLTIRYISTAGEYGNVKARTLNTISSLGISSVNTFIGEIELSSDDFAVINQSSITNGKDPETIDQMYQSFKKVVGTFDTLVTTKDYTNAVYNLTDDYGQSLISNDVVTDRRNDYNYATNVVTYDEEGSYFENISLGLSDGITKFNFTEESSEQEPGDIIYSNGSFLLYNPNNDSSNPWVPITSISFNDFVNATEQMTPYDLCIYALKTFSMAEYSSLTPEKALNNSFTPASNETIKLVRNELGELKCINHTFRDLRNEDIVCFKNYVPLNITIIPYSKVTKLEKAEIIDNIYRSLSENFNARMVDFGEELNYDEVLKVLLNSDERIKNIRLEDFEYNPVALYNDGSEVPLYTSGSELLIDMVAKNVLAGRLCLFNFDDNFDYSYGQQNTAIVNDVVQLETSASISLSDEGATLHGNEFVEIVYPNYYSTIIYPAYCYYRAELNDTVPKNTDYKLVSGESLTVIYTGAESTSEYRYYGVGTVINASFDLKDIDNITNTYTKDYGSGSDKFAVLGSNEQIAIREPLTTVLSNPRTPCYWILNQNNAVLFDSYEAGDSSEETGGYGYTWRILNTGEYFIYSNSTLDSMVIMGPGTMITRGTNDTSQISLSAANTITITSISQEGFNSEINWKYLDLSSNNFELQEMNIISLSEGNTISLESSEESTNLGNTWKSINGPIKYTIDEEVTLPDSSAGGYFVRSRLDINTASGPQELFEGQHIKGTGENGEILNITVESSGDSHLYFQTSIPLDLNGDSNINLSNLIADGSFSVMYCTYTDPMLQGYSYSRDEGPYDDTTTYYYLNQNEYAPISGATINSLTSESSSDLGVYYTRTSDENPIYPVDDVYRITLDGPGRATFPMSYQNTFSGTTEEGIREYILPIYLTCDSENAVPIIASIENIEKLDPEDSNTEISISIEDYGQSSPASTLVMDNNEMYLLHLVVSNPLMEDESSEETVQSSETVTVRVNFDLVLEWAETPTTTETITLYPPKITEGINSNLESSGIILSSVIDRINSMIEDSNSTDIKPYYINEPENSLAIQNEDISNSNILWDKNNVANIITIPQIDILNSDIDIIKSMRNY